MGEKQEADNLPLNYNYFNKIIENKKRKPMIKMIILLSTTNTMRYSPIRKLNVLYQIAYLTL